MVRSGLSCCLSGKESACSARDLGSIPGQEDPLEKGMTTHSCILAWRIPWTEEPHRLQSMLSQRIRHNWVLTLSLFQGQSSSWHLARVSWRQVCLFLTVQSPELRERHVVHTASDFILSFCKPSETSFKSIPWKQFPLVESGAIQ